MDFEEGEVLERLRQRDPALLQSILDAYLPQILRAARNVGLPRQEAEDVVQETFLTFLEGLDRFEGRSKVRTWIFGILYRKIFEGRRRRQREDAMEDIDGVMESRFDSKGRWLKPPRSPDDELFDEQIRKYLRGCMEKLPERHRMTFHLHEVEGLGTEEICEILAITRNNLGVILYRARNALRECLESAGLSPAAR